MNLFFNQQKQKEKKIVIRNYPFTKQFINNILILLNKEMIRQTQKIFNALLIKKAIAFNFGAHGQINRDKIILRNQKSGYYLDPNEVARRIMRVISLHDNVKNPQSMTLNTQWWELGINELDYVEIMIGVENEFRIEISDEVVQKFKDINDAVEYVSRSFWAA